jgi:hypothetical protein
MVTLGAARAVAGSLSRLTEDPGVVGRRALTGLGVSADQVRANLNANRWRQIGSAIVLHAGPLSRPQQIEVARLNCGSRALVTGFTAAEILGLQGWDKPAVHILVPVGTRSPVHPELDVRLHRTGDWSRVQRHPVRPIHRLAPALLVAAATFTGPRPACGIVAAGVQQRLVTVPQMRLALEAAPRLLHRGAVASAVEDMGQGAQALSEIDFVALCRRFKLPKPAQQTVRTDRQGRRRYLDATWVLPNGRVLVVEVDGAVHLSVSRWCDDQLRQNDLVLAGAVVLRFPSVVVRHEAAAVAAQLRRALIPEAHRGL